MQSLSKSVDKQKFRFGDRSHDEIFFVLGTGLTKSCFPHCPPKSIIINYLDVVDKVQINHNGARAVFLLRPQKQLKGKGE